MKLFEKKDNALDTLNIGKRPLIKKWLDEMKIENYTINKDFSIDVSGNVNLHCKKLTKIPNYIKFNHIYGHFDCYFDKLDNLEPMCPLQVDGYFICSANSIKFNEKDNVKWNENNH